MSFGIPFFELSFFQQYQTSLPSIVQQEILEKQPHEMRPDRSRTKHNKRVASLIAPRLYLTCLSTAENANQLASLGITHVLSVIEDEPSFPSSIPLRKLHVSISDHQDSDILKYLPATTSFIRGALAESRSNRVLVRPRCSTKSVFGVLTMNIGPLCYGYQPECDRSDRIPYRHQPNDAARGARRSPGKAADRKAEPWIHDAAARVPFKVF